MNFDNLSFEDLLNPNMMEQYIKTQVYNQLMEIAETCLDLYKSAIEDKVYSYYTPRGWNKYDRTRSLIDCLVYEIVPDSNQYYKLRLSENISPATYFSVVNHNDVSSFVPMWVDKGHNDDSDIYNQYHHYEGRGYNEEGISRIQEYFDSKGLVFNEYFD